MIRLRCHEKDYKFQPKLTDVDLVPGSISSNNPSVAQGHPGRVGFGTAGDIAIDAEGVTGDATTSVRRIAGRRRAEILRYVRVHPVAGQWKSLECP